MRTQIAEIVAVVVFALAGGAISLAQVVGGFFMVMLTAGWSPGAHTPTETGLHQVYLRATIMTWAAGHRATGTRDREVGASGDGRDAKPPPGLEPEVPANRPFGDRRDA